MTARELDLGGNRSSLSDVLPLLSCPCVAGEVALEDVPVGVLSLVEEGRDGVESGLEDWLPSAPNPPLGGCGKDPILTVFLKDRLLVGLVGLSGLEGESLVGDAKLVVDCTAGTLSLARDEGVVFREVELPGVGIPEPEESRLASDEFGVSGRRDLTLLLGRGGSGMLGGPTVGADGTRREGDCEALERPETCIMVNTQRD